MAKEDGYLQFPISFLSGESTTGEIVLNAAAYAARNIGLLILEKDPPSIGLIVASYLATKKSVNGFDENIESHKCALAGAAKSGYSPVDFQDFVSRGIQLHESTPAGPCCVRLRTDIAISARDDNWPVMKLKILCGVISSIGDHKIMRLTHRMIRARSDGLNSPKGLKEYDMVPKSTASRWIESLWQSNFFQRVSRGKDYWYSIRHANDIELAVAVKDHLAAKKHKKHISVIDVAPVESILPKKKTYKSHRAEKLLRLGFATYKEYLASDLWKTIRTRILIRDSNTCQKCGNRAEQVHHRTYGMATLGGCHDVGLVSLCRDCHHYLEFDGERKRLRKEIRTIDTEWFPGRRFSFAHGRPLLSGKSIASRKAQRIKSRKNWTGDWHGKPASEKQISRIARMWRQLEIPLEGFDFDELTEGEFVRLNGELQKKINAMVALKKIAVDEELKQLMQSKPRVDRQKTLI